MWNFTCKKKPSRDLYAALNSFWRIRTVLLVQYGIMNLARRSLLLIPAIIVFTLIPARPAQAAMSLQTAPPGQATVAVEAANLRAGPGTDHPIVGGAQAGDTLDVIACNDGCTWYQLVDGAWIAAFLVQSASPAPLLSSGQEISALAVDSAALPAKQPVAAADANLRAGPGTDYPIRGGVVAGDPLAVVATNANGDWLQLARPDGSRAWIAAFLVANAPADLPVVTPSLGAGPVVAIDLTTVESATLSQDLQAAVSVYLAVARANVRSVNGRAAVVPSPVYANGIYARDAFYTVLGLGDVGLAADAFRWFEQAQNAQSGQITTAISLDPADASLQPQDDETTLLYLIWAGYLRRAGVDVDEQVVGRAWAFVQSHVTDGAYVSLPGQFRYWADCWRLDQPDTITYNQGLYALAARLLAATGLAGVTQADAEAAAAHYRSLYRADLGFLPLSAGWPGRDVQDVSALLPEFLHRFLFGSGLLEDAAVLATVDRSLRTAVVYGADGAPAGIKNVARADGAFADPAWFACADNRSVGDYHNGGYWPMYTLVELALAYGIQPRPAYRTLMETLAARETAAGTTQEYWNLGQERIGEVQPGRTDYAWNALIVPAMRWAGLVE